MVIPAGCTVVVATVKLHRNPEIYPNPTVFNPDNFLPEASANRHYYAFVPFSAGPRSCVGKWKWWSKLRPDPRFDVHRILLKQSSERN